MLVAPLHCTSRMSLERHVVVFLLLVYTLALGVWICWGLKSIHSTCLFLTFIRLATNRSLYILASTGPATYVQASNHSAACVSNWYTVYDQYSHRSAVYVSQTDTQYTISTHIDLQYTCLKLIHSIQSVLTSICNIRVSNWYTVYDQYSHRSAVYVSQTYTQYTISTHIDLQYMCLKPIHCLWSVLNSICSICDSNWYTVHDQFSHRSAVYVTQAYTQYMISTHIDLQYMGLKLMCSIWSVLTSICCVCDSNQ